MLNTQDLDPILREAIRKLSVGRTGSLSQQNKNALVGYIEHLTDLVIKHRNKEADSPSQESVDNYIQDLKGEIEAYRVALGHIANGHPSPAPFARALLRIGDDK